MGIQALIGPLLSGANLFASGMRKIGEESSAALCSLYSLSGFEKTAKATLSTVRVFSYLVPDSQLLRSFAKTVGMHKDLCCATSIIGNLANFVQTDSSGKTRLSLRDSHGSTDYMNLFLTFANVCETGKFLQKNGICSFPMCSAFASQIGSVQLFPWGDTVITCEDIPVIGSLFSSGPKGFFVFIASCIEVNRLRIAGTWDLAAILKCANALGKMVIIFFVKPLKSNPNLLVISIVLDVVTNYTALFAYICKERKARINR